MLSWLSLVLGVIQAVKLVIEILDLLKARNGANGPQGVALHEILLAWRDHKDKAKLIADLKALRDGLTKV